MPSGARLLVIAQFLNNLALWSGMIESKVIKGIALGAGCLLGMRNCLIKKLPTSSTSPYAKEIIRHIEDLFLAAGYSLDHDTALNLRTAITNCKSRDLKTVFNAIYVFYQTHRTDMYVLWNHFRDKEITYANFTLIRNQKAIKEILFTCVDCLSLFEKMLNLPNETSEACKLYLQTHALTEQEFNHILKPIIVMRLLQEDKPRVTSVILPQNSANSAALVLRSIII